MMENCETALAKLNAKEITFQQFLEEVDCHKQFEKWCAEHHLKADEGAAQLFFDHYGFEDETIVKEFVEPLAS
ncbi:MAG: hypothetical protein K2N34_08830 [Lachnospiraceae bacterium]|nr:hypothetical protein [Lachnospiraceae bacterium]